VGTRISRRELLASAAPALGCIGIATLAPAALLGCGVPTGRELDQRIVAALRSVVAGSAGSRALSRVVGMTEGEALQMLRGDLSDLRLYALTSNRYSMRRFIAERRSRDLREGRSRYVDGWLLADTEVAIAVVLGF
jgi:hypothetical protein